MNSFLLLAILVVALVQATISSSISQGKSTSSTALKSSAGSSSIKRSPPLNNPFANFKLKSVIPTQTKQNNHHHQHHKIDSNKKKGASSINLGGVVPTIVALLKYALVAFVIRSLSVETANVVSNGHVTVAKESFLDRSRRVQWGLILAGLLIGLSLLGVKAMGRFHPYSI